jgi:type II secretory pathway component PulJ
MILRSSQFHSRRRCQSGLTLVEILVASALLLMLTVGLTLMFNQTQRAFRTGIKQMDVVETGRTALEMIARDFEQAVDAQQNVTILALGHYSALDVIQNENGAPFRTNTIYEIYALNRDRGDWVGTGYAVANTIPGVGTLQRFTYRTNSDELTIDPYNIFLNELSTSNYQHFNRVIDGVIHFQVNAVDASGVVISTNVLYYPNPPGELTNRLPVALEIELGILEPRVVEQARSYPTAALRQNYLKQQAGKVHIFRQQIPIRTAVR